MLLPKIVSLGDSVEIEPDRSLERCPAHVPGRSAVHCNMVGYRSSLGLHVESM